MPQSPPAIYPCLSYQDAPAAIEWLERVFGFEKQHIIPNPDNTIAHGEMSFGNGIIMLASTKPERGWVSPRDLPGLNQTVYVAVEDIDTHYALAKAAGAEILDELADHDYGRLYTARDLEGHVWTFGTYRAGVPAPGS